MSEIIRLTEEVERLKQRLQESQASEREFRQQMFSDAVIGEILRARDEIRKLKVIEQELLDSIEEEQCVSPTHQGVDF
jgi:hypothetical protein